MNRMNKKENGTLKYRMAEVTSMPKDVVLGVPIVTIIGKCEVRIENYQGIIEYTELLIRIKVKDSQIRVVGRNLQIEYYTNDDMMIMGNIEKVEYQ